MAIGDVWQYRCPSARSVKEIVPPQRFDTGADTLLPTSASLVNSHLIQPQQMFCSVQDVTGKHIFHIT
jgi:hypothetical protein